MSDFTPGPWTARTSRVIEAPHRRVAASGEVMEYGKEIAWTQPVGSDATRAANARLIAAAPELYEALDNAPLPSTLGNREDHYRRFYDWFNNVAAPALAKARGEA